MKAKANPALRRSTNCQPVGNVTIGRDNGDHTNTGVDGGWKDTRGRMKDHIWGRGHTSSNGGMRRKECGMMTSLSQRDNPETREGSPGDGTGVAKLKPTGRM